MTKRVGDDRVMYQDILAGSSSEIKEQNQEDAKLKKLVKKFGKYNVAVFFIMGIGVILFLLTPLLLWLFDFDSDIIGVLIFLIGLVMFVAGLFIRFIIKTVRSN